MSPLWRVLPSLYSHRCCLPVTGSNYCEPPPPRLLASSAAQLPQSPLLPLISPIPCCWLKFPWASSAWVARQLSHYHSLSPAQILTSSKFSHRYFHFCLPLPQSTVASLKFCALSSPYLFAATAAPAGLGPQNFCKVSPPVRVDQNTWGIDPGIDTIGIGIRISIGQKNWFLSNSWKFFLWQHHWQHLIIFAL